MAFPWDLAIQGGGVLTLLDLDKKASSVPWISLRPGGFQQPNMEKTRWNVVKHTSQHWWFGWWWLEPWNFEWLSSIILGMSSSQVTKSYFSEGLKPPTSNLSWFYNRNGSRSKTCDFFIKIPTPHSKRCHTWSLIWVDQPTKLILSTLITKHVI